MAIDHHCQHRDPGANAHWPIVAFPLEPRDSCACGANQSATQGPPTVGMTSAPVEGVKDDGNSWHVPRGVQQGTGIHVFFILT